MRLHDICCQVWQRNVQKEKKICGIMTRPSMARTPLRTDLWNWATLQWVPLNLWNWAACHIVSTAFSGEQEVLRKAGDKHIEWVAASGSKGWWARWQGRNNNYIVSHHGVPLFRCEKTANVSANHPKDTEMDEHRLTHRSSSKQENHIISCHRPGIGWA